LERARLNHHKSPYPSIQLSHRLWLIGKNVLRTRNPMIGSLPAGGAGEEGRTGDKRSYANTFVLWRYTSEFRNDSDGICKNYCGIQLCDPRWTFTLRRSLKRILQRKRRSCRWSFLPMEATEHLLHDRTRFPYSRKKGTKGDRNAPF
jgi:hypothetical protein